MTKPMEPDEINEGDRFVLCELISGLRTFADRSYQERVWVRGEGPQVDAYTESLVDILEDRRLFEFAGPLGRYYGLSDDAIDAIRLFGSELDAFDKQLTIAEKKEDNLIISRPEWDRIRSLAAVACEKCGAFFGEHCDE